MVSPIAMNAPGIMLPLPAPSITVERRRLPPSPEPEMEPAAGGRGRKGRGGKEGVAMGGEPVWRRCEGMSFVVACLLLLAAVRWLLRLFGLSVCLCTG